MLDLVSLNDTTNSAKIANAFVIWRKTKYTTK